MNKLPLGTVSYIQSMLRLIAHHRNEILSIIPDGLFGQNTKNSVASFQKFYGMYITGEVDNDTWNKIVGIFEEVEKEKNLNVFMQVFNEMRKPIRLGEHSADIYVIQAMITALSEKFDNIHALFVTGTYDKATADAVRKIQILSGITPNNLIDAEFVNALTQLYNAYVTRNRTENSFDPE